ncbi:MAG: peptidase domain-containing ABC transporter, partial [bacterium]
MIAKHHGRAFSLQYLRDKSFITREGVSLLGISEAAETIGMRSLSVRTTFEKFQEEAPLPCIAHWKQNHFIVVHKITKNKVHVADPAHGLLTYTAEEFKKNWISFHENGKSEGVLLLLEPTLEFRQSSEEGKPSRVKFKIFFSYLFAYKKYLGQLFLGMLLGSILGLIFPFLTQSLVDFGINNQNLGFIYTILIAQLMLFFSRACVDFIQSWILLHITTRINISIISDFLIKMMKLPMPFFDSRMIGDLLQRIGDHRRIESFMTSTTLNTLFSSINLVVYSLILTVYNLTVFAIFAGGSVIYVAWILIFLKRRRELDYKRFNELSANQSNLIQLINGMPEIKLNNCERQKRWEWEHIQAKLFKLNVKGLVLSQYQQAGTFFINELKNILITFLVAKAVVDGDMTLGMMMAVQYILGQLNAPIGQLISFIQVAQDAKISLERLGEIHEREDEEKPDDNPITVFPKDRSLYMHEVDFQYEGPHSPFILKNLTLEISQNKVTAIVGVSGSGKTTLIKLLLKFYQPVRGEIKIGDINLKHFSNRAWRDKCGVVMQDGFLFAETIARNIALGDERIDQEKLLRAVMIANIRDDIEALPLGYNTRIGMDGHGLSQGQK